VQALLLQAETGLPKDSCCECGHITTIDRARAIDEARGILGHVQPSVMARVDAAVRASLAL
jgi:mRNA-degrading endonuclease toxin of MazEF toxin-antitoxin module